MTTIDETCNSSYQGQGIIDIVKLDAPPGTIIDLVHLDAPPDTKIRRNQTEIMNEFFKT